ncbi:MAG: ComF family protein [Elusimicrobiota bacterium]
MASFYQRLLNFFFPLTCAACGQLLKADTKTCFCPDCRKEIEFIQPPFCQRCGQFLPDGGRLCFLCRKNHYYFESIRSVCKYNEVMKKAIHKFKYRKQNYLYKFLGNLLIDYLSRDEKMRKSFDLIIPVPLHWLRYHKRGFNQAGLLAKTVSTSFDKPLMIQNLRRVRRTKPQYTLPLKLRPQNISGTFAVKNKELIKEKNILLIDDICTTKTTLNECARVLKKAGANTIHCLVLAQD